MRDTSIIIVDSVLLIVLCFTCASLSSVIICHYADQCRGSCSGNVSNGMRQQSAVSLSRFDHRPDAERFRSKYQDMQCVEGCGPGQRRLDFEQPVSTSQ